MFYFLFVGVFIADAQPNYAIEFSGDYDYANLKSDASIKPTQQLTLELFAWQANWSDERYTPTLAGNTQHKGYAIAIDLGKLYGCIQFNYPTPPHNLYYNLDLLTPGWHHFAITYDGQISRLLVDGEVVVMMSNEKPTPIGQPDSSVTFMIGAETRYNGEPYMHLSYFFKGRIDDLNIWDIAKTPQQIRQQLLSKPNLDDPHLCASFDFDSVAHQMLFDKSKHQVHATLIGGPSLLPSNAPVTNWLLPWLNKWPLIKGYQIVCLLLMLCGLGWLVWKLIQLDLINRIWLVAFALLAILNSLTGYFALYESFVTSEFVPFWNLHHMYCVYFLSTACLLRFLWVIANTNGLLTLKYGAWVQLVPFIPIAFAINALAVSVAISRYMIIVMSVVLIMAVFYTAFLQRAYAKYILIGGIGLLLGTSYFAIAAFGLIGNVVKTPNELFTFLIIECLGFGAVAIYTPDYKGQEVDDNAYEQELFTQPTIQMLLSKREWEVYSLLLLGHTDKEIADQLFVSLNTVKTHIKKIYQKLGVRNRMEAAALSKK